ncbi:hypothetical protein ACI75Y_06820 [Capnocytophaga stomatis]|uniref:hypothetical protein n=1 Tax=Capnocytophaga stomatis TaxID=1848904 RepID=UPI00385DAE15
MKQSIPKELQEVISEEPIDFYVFAERKVPRVASVFFIFFGILWTMVVLGIGGFDFEEKFGASGDSFYNMMNVYLLIVNGIFVLVGIGITVWGVVTFFQNGGHFIGTPTRLIHYKKRKTQIYSWSDFTGNMDLNVKNGGLTFYTHSDKKVYDRNRNYMICRSVHLFSAENILEIVQIAYQRITENKDPNKYIF